MENASLLDKLPGRGWEKAGTAFTAVSTLITVGAAGYLVYKDPSSWPKMVALFIASAFGAIGFGCHVKSLGMRQVVVIERDDRTKEELDKANQFLQSLDQTLKTSDRRTTLTQSMETLLQQEIPHTKSITNEIDRLFNLLTLEAQKTQQQHQEIESQRRAVSEQHQEIEKLQQNIQLQTQETSHLQSQLQQRDETHSASNTTVERQEQDLKKLIQANDELKKRLQEMTDTHQKSLSLETQKSNQLNSQVEELKLQNSSLSQKSEETINQLTAQTKSHEKLLHDIQQKVDSLTQALASETQRSTQLHLKSLENLREIESTKAEAHLQHNKLITTIDKTTKLLVNLVNKINPDLKFQITDTDSVENLKTAWSAFKTVWMEHQKATVQILEANSVAIYNELAEVKDALSSRIQNIGTSSKPFPKEFVTQSRHLDPVVLQNQTDIMKVLSSLLPATMTNSIGITSPTKTPRHVTFRSPLQSPMSPQYNTPPTSPEKPIQVIEPDDLN